MRKTVWLIGAGQMAIEYALVLKDMHVNIVTIGRGSLSAEEYTKITGLPVQLGGVEHYLSQTKHLPDMAIIAVGVAELENTCQQIIRYGVKRILLEKPGALNAIGIKRITEIARKEEAVVFVAYNRRFYASVQRAIQIIEDDGGVESFIFEFTEWGHVVSELKKPLCVMNAWFLANSSHVADMAFFLGGRPREIECRVKGRCEWHPKGTIFAGSGVTFNGAFFSYQANWEAPGRWGVEIITRSNRLIFRPLEQLQIMRKGSVDTEQVQLDTSLEKKYKPGLFLEVHNFIYGSSKDLCTIEEQAFLAPIYEQIAGYSTENNTI